MAGLGLVPSSKNWSCVREDMLRAERGAKRVVDVLGTARDAIFMFDVPIRSREVEKRSHKASLSHALTQQAKLTTTELAMPSHQDSEAASAADHAMLDAPAQLPPPAAEEIYIGPQKLRVVCPLPVFLILSCCKRSVL